MTIRSEQLFALAAEPDRGLVLRLVEHARTAFPERFADDETLEGLVAREVEVAASFGLRSYASIARYLNLCLVYGFAMHEDSARRWMFEDYLEDPCVPDPDARLALLVDECARRLEVEARNAGVHARYPEPVRASPIVEHSFDETDDADAGEGESEGEHPFDTIQWDAAQLAEALAASQSDADAGAGAFDTVQFDAQQVAAMQRDAAGDEDEEDDEDDEVFALRPADAERS